MGKVSICLGYNEPKTHVALLGLRAMNAYAAFHANHASARAQSFLPPRLLQARMRGRYLWQKLELLLSFFLLAPLWTAMAWVLQQVGGQRLQLCPSGQHACCRAGQEAPIFQANCPLLSLLLTLQLGLSAPPPPPLAGGASCTPRPQGKPDITFKAAGTAAKAACKWRRAVRGELDADESLMHEACTIIERRTMSRCGWASHKAAQCCCPLR